MATFCWVCPNCDYKHEEGTYHAELLCGRCGEGDLKRDWRAERVGFDRLSVSDSREGRVDPRDIVMQPEDARRRAIANIAKRDHDEHGGPRRDPFGNPKRPPVQEIRREADKVITEWNNKFRPQKAGGDKYRPRTSGGTF